MKKNNRKFLTLFVFTILGGLSASLSFEAFDLLSYTLMDVLLLALSMIVFRLQEKSLASANPHQFVRSVMGGMILKMFVFIAAVIIYVMAMAGKYSISTITGFMLLYLIYLVAEVRMILILNKKPHA